MKRVALSMLLVASAACVEAADPPPSLAAHRCTICHAERETLTGPAFADVALAYKGRRDAVATVAAQIRSGIKSGGPWHMPPHPEITSQEAREMARYILSVQPEASDPAAAVPPR